MVVFQVQPSSTLPAAPTVAQPHGVRQCLPGVVYTLRGEPFWGALTHWLGQSRNPKAGASQKELELPGGPWNQGGW